MKIADSERVFAQPHQTGVALLERVSRTPITVKFVNNANPSHHADGILRDHVWW